jgi:ATP-dependent DNA helicase DinG
VRQHVPATAVYTSATLSTAGRFDFIRDRLGLNDDVAELSVASPFAYPERALLYLPRDLPLPDDPAYMAAATERMAQLAEITAGRALVLFTSWRALRQAAAILRARLPFPVLVQGESPRGALLSAFRRDVGSVLLATSSFREGVDVPGEALSLVIIDRLPFQPPDDPLAAARAARIEERGEDAFLRHHLPRAAIALKQAFGRLIRRRDDRGIVAILDARILVRNYGRDLVATLPPAARTSALEQVRRFWHRRDPFGTPVVTNG